MRGFVTHLVVVGLLAALLVVVPFSADPGVAQTAPDGAFLVNVAVDGTASQSTEDFGGAAARAIDGNTSGVWQDGSVTHTAAGDGLPWWEVALVESVTIDSIVLWNRTNCCSDRLADFTVFVSDVPFEADATIPVLVADPTVWSYTFDGVAGERVEIPVNARGGFVRVQKPAGSALSLAEVEVFTSTQVTEAGDNVALDGAASQSSTRFNGVAGRAIDGNTSGVFNQNSVTHTNPDSALQWWQVDLGVVTDIDSVTLWNRTNCCSDRLADFSVFISAAPFPADATIAELQADPGVWSYSFDGVAGESVEIPVVGAGRYVRVQKPAGSALSLAEVQVFEALTGTPPVEPVNVALDGTASQSSTRAAGGAAGRAIDGNTSGVFSQNSVTHTNPNSALQWWELELAEPTNINNIVIWNRTDSCCTTRLADFTVFVSASPFPANATIAQLEASPDVTAFSFAGVAGVTTDIQLNASGRYVRIQKPAGSALSLAEVQIFEAAEVTDPPSNVAPSDLLVSSGAPGESVQLSWDPLGIDEDAVSFAIFADGELVEELEVPNRVWDSPPSLAGTQVWAVAARSAAGALSDATELVVKDATSLLAAGETEGCRTIALEDGQTIIRVDDAADGWSQALYQDESGEFVPFKWLADHPELPGIRSEVDSVTEHAGLPAVSYRVVTYGTDDVIRTYPCDPQDFDSVYDELVGDGFPVLPSGVIGADMSDAGLPTRVVVPDPVVPAEPGGPSVQDAVPSCSAGGLFLSAVPPDAQQPRWISVDVPEGVTVSVDIMSRRLAANNGAWIAEFDVFATNSDGSLGAGIGGRDISTPYWWANGFLDLPDIGEDRYHLDDFPLFTAEESGTYLISGVINSLQVGPGDLSQPSTRLEDIKFWDSADPDTRQLIAEPCANSQHYDCQVAGGNTFVENEVVLDDGTVLAPGCYEWEHCATPTVGWAPESLAIWACEHQTGLQQALMIGAVLAVGGLMIIGGSAAGAPGVGIGAATGLATSLWSCNQNEYSLLAESFDDLNGSCVATEIGLGAVFGAVAGPAAGASTTFPRLLGVACAWGAVEGATGVIAHGYVQEDESVNALNTLVGAGAGCGTAGVITTGGRAASSLLPGRPRADVVPERNPTLDNIDAQFSTRAERIDFLEANGNTVRKANFGEMNADQAFADLQLDDFDILHSPRITSIDSPITTGIDHVFTYRDSLGQIRYVIAETKYSLDGTVTTTASALTNDGRQMSDQWLLGSDRLSEAGLSYDVIDEVIEAIEAGNIERVLISVDIGGTVSFREIDPQGIAGAVWSPS